jgi:hypothetical protein
MDRELPLEQELAHRERERPMHNQSSPHGTASHGQEHSCYQHYLLQRELAQRQIASLQQLYRQQREVKRLTASTRNERLANPPDSACPRPVGQLILPLSARSEKAPKSAEAARRATLTTFRTALGDRGRQCIGQRLCPDLAFLG